MALEKPEIDFPEGEPPTELTIVDLTDGDGREAKPGDTRPMVHYVGVAWSSGEEFDASWNRRRRSPSRSAPVGSSRAGTRAWSA